MKRALCALLAVCMLAALGGCGKEKEETTNTILPTALTPREQILVGSQDIFMYDFETDDTYHTINVTVEAYKNGEKISNAANLQCAIPAATEKNANRKGSLAVMLSADQRFSAVVCDQDGSSLSAFDSDVVEPVSALQKLVSSEVTDRQAIPASGNLTLAYLAYGNTEATQAATPKNVFLDPLSNQEQSAAFDRIFIIRCSFT